MLHEAKDRVFVRAAIFCLIKRPSAPNFVIVVEKRWCFVWFVEIFASRVHQLVFLLVTRVIFESYSSLFHGLSGFLESVLLNFTAIFMELYTKTTVWFLELNSLHLY